MARRRRTVWRVAAAVAALLAASACDGIVPVATNTSGSEAVFPAPDRQIAKVVSNQFSSEDARDERN